MKTFKEYYDRFKADEEKWYRNQKTEWWKDQEYFKYFEPKGQYLETTSIISIDDKQDSSLSVNHTNVRNSEWGIFFSILGQALVDWCVENGETQVWKYGVRIERVVEGLDDILVPTHNVKVMTEKGWEKIDPAEETFKHFDGCDQVMCDLLDQFLTIHRKDIPLDWNHFGFGLDNLDISCKWGEWVPSSDGSISFGNEHDGEKYDTYDVYVECC